MPAPDIDSDSAQREQRVLVLAPRGRDQDVILRVLGSHDIRCEGTASLGSLTAALQQGAGAAVMADEALHSSELEQLVATLDAQLAWSDFPFVILVSSEDLKAREASNQRLARLGNVIVLERPLNTETLYSATQAALRARRRQYAARDVLTDLSRTADSLHNSKAELVRLNETLESRIDERTRALALANDRLMTEAFERERVQQALMQFQKMEAVGQLTGGIAHDFNNLLNVVQGSMDLILLMSTDATTRRRAEVARKACQQGAKLTSQLLAFSRNQRLDLKPTAVAAMLAGVRELLSTSLGSAVRFTIAVEDNADYVMADTNQMEMALINLAINARDAMPGGGELSVHAARALPGAAPAELSAGDYVRIAVNDTGIGMSASVMAKVFEPFFTTKGVGKGTGLGLSQVYGMAQQSGGTALVSSTQGQGTTVEIWLRVAVAPTLAQPVETRSGLRMGHAGARILVVEDDNLVRQSMVESLEALGYLVTPAGDGEAGLRELQRERPHLMITDYLMPGMTGAELVRRANIDYPGLPMIISTGYADMEAVDKVIGNNFVLRKPFELSELANSVDKALHKV
ncbi:MAG: response regulator [Pseudomonadota bacterium]|nr:response regulator [Pseudomonadota bacterium]